MIYLHSAKSEQTTDIGQSPLTWRIENESNFCSNVNSFFVYQVRGGKSGLLPDICRGTYRLTACRSNARGANRDADIGNDIRAPRLFGA